jgi:hypothetical protein
MRRIEKPPTFGAGRTITNNTPTIMMRNSCGSCFFSDEKGGVLQFFPARKPT